MPESKSDFEFFSALTLALQTEGVDDALKGLNRIKKSMSDTGTSAQDLVGQYGSVSSAVKTLAKDYKATGAAADRALSATEIKLLKIKNTIKSLTSPLKGAGSAFQKLVMPTSFGAALKTVDDYNKTMLSLSASVSRLGMGFTSLESNLTRIGKEMSLTRAETNKLFADFESGMRTVSMGDFEAIMKRVRDTVGSNADAMGKMASAVAELSQSYPSLSRSLTDLAKNSESMSMSEKAALQTRVRNLYLIGKISDAQYKQISAYAKGNQQVGKWDSERKKAVDDQVKAVKDFQRQWENVSMAVGQTLMPMLPKIANFIKTAFEWTEKWLGSTKKLGAAIIAAMAIKGVVGGMVAKGGSMLMGKMLGGGGKGGLGGKAGGLISSVTGIGATPVKVVNFDVMARFNKLNTGKQLARYSKYLGGKAAKQAAVSATGQAVGTAAVTGGTTMAFKFGLAVGKVGLALKSAALFGLKLTAGFAKLVLGMSAASLAIAAIGAVAIYAASEFSKAVDTIETEMNMTQKDISMRIAAPGRGEAFDKRVTEMKSSKRYAAARQFQQTWKRKQERIIYKEKDPGKREEKLAELQKERDIAQAAFKKKVTSGEFGETERGRTARRKLLRTEREKTVEQARDDTRASINKKGLVATRDTAAKEERVAQKTYDELAGRRDKEGKYDPTSYRGRRKALGEQKETIGAKTAKLAKDSAGMSAEDLKRSQKKIDYLQLQYNAAEDKLQIDEENDKALQDSLTTLQKTQSVMEEITAISQMQKDIADSISSLASGQLSVMDAMIEKAALLGQINEKELKGALTESLMLLDAKEVALQAALDILKSDLSVAQKKKALAEGETEQQKVLYAGLVEAGILNKDGVDVATASKNLEAQRLGITRERSNAMNSQAKMYDVELAKTGLLADRAGLMVQLADNYAMGVGASAQMRIDAYQAQEKEIGVLEQQLAKQRESAAIDGASEEVKNKVYEIENKILSKQMAQAQQVRALRDGWVSAIGAMNAGAGGFTDIVMTQQKGLALSQKMAGSVKADVLGRIGQGYDTSESFTRQTGVMKGDKGFTQPFDDGINIMAGFERGEWDKALATVIKRLKESGAEINEAAIAGAMGLGATGATTGRLLQGVNPSTIPTTPTTPTTPTATPTAPTTPTIPVPAVEMSKGGVSNGNRSYQNTFNISLDSVAKILKEVERRLDDITRVA